MRRLAPLLLLLALSACSLIDDSVPTCTAIPDQADDTITRITTVSYTHLTLPTILLV